MELTPYVEALRAQLATVGEIGGPETAALAERLSDALESGVRLAIQQALCDGAEQITRDLAPGSVEVRLRAHELDFVTTLPSTVDHDITMTPPMSAMPPGLAAGRVTESAETPEAGTARISFRPPESLKVRIEDAAERAGMSVNAFLVSTLTSALDSPPQAARTHPRGEAVRGWFA